MRWKTTLLLLLVTVGVGAYVSLYELKQPTIEERQQRSKQVVRVEEDKVTGLEIAAPAGPVALAKDGGAWKLTAPHAARADANQVRRLLYQLDPVESDRALGAVGALKDFGLEPPMATLSAKTGDKTVTILLGDRTPVGGNRYLKLSDQPAIYVVSSLLFDAVTQPWESFRSRQVMDGDPSAVTQLALESPSGSWTVGKQERWRLLKPLEDQADPDTVSSIIRKLHGLRIERFIQDEPSAEQLTAWGLQPPASRIVLTAETSEKPLEVAIGNPSDKPEELYVKRTDEPAVYAVKKDALEELAQDPQALRSRAVLDIAPGQVTKIQLAWQGSAWTIEKPDGQWRASDGTGLESTKIEDWLWKLRDLKLTRFVEDEPKDLGRYGLEPTAGAIQVWLKDQADAKEVLIGNTIDQGKSRYGKISGRPSVVELPDGLEAIVTTTADSLRSSPQTPAASPSTGS